ncbi:multiple sugar transport system permease protein [Streptosporangium becharense]|uniref:Multiple sugar transport system permease protein n=1 Tax=Streptosporangium becharense TaxID=1816182 RepID=A0A7W9MGZ4_9ACTN|nr:sugar ABC transporter permease [Streptosporangium becharense]MBB2914784.1 multiple sugar transport system permease protein [Streptosporangium becharense]MBB5820405.1 multiple sugar transport system permease protein [Streptosporangium becharense]
MTSVRENTPGPGRSGRRGPAVAPYLMTAPAVALFVVFILVPIGYAIWLSLHAMRVRGTGLGIRSEVFIGLENYLDAVRDTAFYEAMQRMLGYGLIMVPATMGLALLFALLLDAPRVGGKRYSRITIFLPYAVPGVIASLLWGFIYLPAVSPITAALEALGLPAADFFGDVSIFFSVANIAVWGSVGFNMVVLYTTLRAIPKELYDAARLDGCAEWQIALKIKIPLLRPALIMTSVFTLIGMLQVFSEPATLRPMTNTVTQDWVPLMRVYQQAFVENDIHLGAATSVMLAGATVLLSLAALAVLRVRNARSDR